MKELNQQKAKIEKMKSDGKDEFDIKKQVEVLGEFEYTLPDSISRLKDGLFELQEIVDEVGADPEVKESPHLVEAESLIAEISAKLEAVKN